MEDMDSKRNFYQYEKNRLKTFTDYASGSDVYYNYILENKFCIDYKLLAKAGFIYSDDHIYCFHCNLKIDLTTINVSDDIIKIHKERGPDCSFAQELYGFESIQKFFASNSRLFKTYGRHNLYSEEYRLYTFIDWPHDWLSPSSLSADGFYYTRQGDRVACISCRLVMSEFKKGCNIREEHKRLSPNCKFYERKTVKYPTISFMFLYPDIPRITNNNYGILEHHTSKHEHYLDIEKRLESFKGWPHWLVQKPQDLAEAGFFYEGPNDSVRCFHCSGNIFNWEKEDIPWNMHAKWHPNCTYVLLKKGADFIYRNNQETYEKNSEKLYHTWQGINSNVSHMSTLILTEFLMDLDIVKCVVSMGYPISIAKVSLVMHVEEKGWPFLRIDEYIDDMNKLLKKNPLFKIEPPTILNRFINETGCAYIQSLQSRIESKSSTMITDIPHDSESTGEKLENTENPTSVEALSETKTMESNINISHPKCKKCMITDALVAVFPCRHVLCEACALVSKDCPKCKKWIWKLMSLNYL
uniref:Baculoviral IAP repeat-containing protein n=1 Tax=Melicertus latisulcatus majanivirus TaxID=2984277 RepID=A0A9C7BVR8_9VIRU|nr:MAG: baculoviral IAP repeat-containing protein [Melicertus latisulcatus majanivirus]